MNIIGIHHIELSVTNLEKSKEFYSKLPGLKVVANYPHFVMFSGKGFYLGLTDHPDKLQEKRFNEFNVGLDHLAFQVKDKEDLEEAIGYFDKEGIQHGEIKQLSNNQYVLAFRDPDNIQLELSWKE